MANPQHLEWLLEPDVAWVSLWNLRLANGKFRPDFANADLFTSFIEAGKFDIGQKIPLAKIDFSYANFTEAVLSYADLTSADLQRADFSRATLYDADLSDASLFGTNLSNADLRGVNFTNADLRGANLAGADLQGANLTDADLRQANLERTHLLRANLTNANLLDAVLMKAVFAGAEPWHSTLESSHGVSPQEGSDIQRQVTTIEDLLSEVREIRGHHSDSLFYFRGEFECGWELRPSVMRDGSIASERDMLVELLSRRPDEFNGMTSALAQWVLAQHHGLRTRFLDITKNPLVALFHACETEEQQSQSMNDGRIHAFAVPKEMVKPFTSDRISVIASFAKLSRCEQEILLGKRKCSGHGAEVETTQYIDANRRLYQTIQQEKPYFDERIDQRDLYRVFVVEPQQSSERIRAQSGAFLVSAFHERFERAHIEGQIAGIPIYAHYQLSIPANNKPDIIDDLRLLNVTRENLFPGLDASAKAITDFYRPE